MSLTRVVVVLLLLYKTDPQDSSSEQPGVADKHVAALGGSVDFLLHEHTLHLITVTYIHNFPLLLFRWMFP